MNVRENILNMAHQAVVDFFYLFKYWLSFTAENMYYDHKTSAITTTPKLVYSYMMISGVFPGPEYAHQFCMLENYTS